MPKIAVFAYNFPHKKTQEVLTRLFLENFQVDLVLAADPVELDIPASSIRTKLRHIGLLHPRLIAERIGSRYEVVEHNSCNSVQMVKEMGIELGIIAGARILKGDILHAFPKGIINFHPGLIPEARGLDALLWSVLKGIPLGVTAHIIDEKIDAGQILLRRKIPLYVDDTVFDLNERLMETQLEMIRPAVKAALSGEGIPLPKGTGYNRKMPPNLEKKAIAMLPSYLKKMIARQNTERK